LYELYNEFYVDEQKKLVRDQLDSPSGREIVGAIMTKKEEALTTEEAALLSQFCDYLNFFEFMIVLKKNGALRDRDIIDMFDYYLRSLLKINGIVFYLKDNGFAHLSEQLTEMSRVATA